jgi:putative sigma-54 modulation protein
MINYNVKGTGLGVTDELRTYVEKRLTHVEKFLLGDTTAHVDVELEFAPLSDSGKYRAEFNLSTHGNVYRAESWGSALHEAIDIGTAELTKEVRKNKKRRLERVRRGAARFKEIIRNLGERI